MTGHCATNTIHLFIFFKHDKLYTNILIIWYINRVIPVTPENYRSNALMAWSNPPQINKCRNTYLHPSSLPWCCRHTSQSGGNLGDTLFNGSQNVKCCVHVHHTIVFVNTSIFRLESNWINITACRNGVTRFNNIKEKSAYSHWGWLSLPQLTSVKPAMTGDTAQARPVKK